MQANCYDIRAIKANFILQGTSFTRFCRNNNVDPSNAIKALKGEWKGVRATEITKLITETVNVTCGE
ncbi:MAG: hypothetical protein QX189_16305 [Methylococcales bacterium]